MDRLLRTVPPDALSAIGGTPLVPLRRMTEGLDAEIFVKVEAFNPTGSYKDRMGLSMVEEAERDGLIEPGRTTIVEYTGGSTGSSLAFVCAVKGYPLKLVSSDAFSEEKIRTMRALGAEVEILPSDGGKITRELMDGIIGRTAELAEQPDTYFTDQCNNPHNPKGYEPMGREILEQTGGDVDAFVAAVGTAGCAMGNARALKSANPDIQVFVVEPSSSAVISGRPPGSHRIEGIALGFVPGVFDRTLVDDVVVIEEAEARATARRLASEEGVFAGTSSGANVLAALKVADRLGNGIRIVCPAVDSGLKYVSTDLYR